MRLVSWRVGVLACWIFFGLLEYAIAPTRLYVNSFLPNRLNGWFVFEDALKT